MAHLRIKFVNLALFAHWSNGLTVLLPNTHHSATLSGGTLSAPRALDGEQIQILCDGIPVRGAVSPPADSQYLVDISKFNPNGWRLASDLSGRVLAHIDLGSNGGDASLSAPHKEATYGPNDAYYQEELWQFTGFSPHKLTDNVTFSLRMRAGSTYALMITDSSGAVAQIPCTPSGATFEIQVEDAVRTVFAKTIDEFGYLYDLFDSTGVTSAMRPLPTDPNPPPSPQPGQHWPLCNFPLCPVAAVDLAEDPLQTRA